MIRISNFLLLIFIVCSRLQAQSPVFSVEQLRADADSLYCMIREIHPNIFANCSQADFETQLAAIKSGIDQPMNRVQLYSRLAPLVESLGDGHTYMSFPRQDLERPEIRLFPFTVTIRWRDSSLVTGEDRSFIPTGVPEGAVILSINKRPVSQIIGTMFHYMSGEKTFFKAAELTFNFTPLLYSLYGDTLFELEYEAGGVKGYTTVKGIPFSERFRNTRQQTGAFSGNYSLKVLPDSSMAILSLFSFRNDEGWKHFLDSSFTILREQAIRDLIIDVRENGGGASELGDLVFQYISPVPFAQFGKTTIRISPRMREFLLKRYDLKIDLPDGLLTEGEDTPLTEPEPNPLRFTGNRYLLISNRTFSSASSFAWAFSYFRMGKVIGEETGGMAVCFGDVIGQELPNTGLSIGISHKKFYQYGATDADMHGTLPDYEVPAEKALDFTKALIMENRR